MVVSGDCSSNIKLDLFITMFSFVESFILVWILFFENLLLSNEINFICISDSNDSSQPDVKRKKRILVA